MNFKMIGRFLSQIIAIEAFFMLPALGISFFRGETAATTAFLYTIGICAAGGHSHHEEWKGGQEGAAGARMETGGAHCPAE